MPWNKLVATLLPLLAIIEACGPTKEPLSTCFVRADNSVWTEHAMTAETFLPPKCPVILPGGVANQSEAYKVDFFAPKADVSVFNIVQVVHITPTGTVQSNVTFPFIPDPYSADAKAQAWGTYFAGVDGFGTPFNPVDSLVAHIPVNTGQLARGVAELRYQPGTLTLNAASIALTCWCVEPTGCRSSRRRIRSSMTGIRAAPVSSATTRSMRMAS